MHAVYNKPTMLSQPQVVASQRVVERAVRSLARMLGHSLIFCPNCGNIVPKSREYQRACDNPECRAALEGGA